MDLQIELIGNPWINAGIVGFYEFHQKYGKSNPDVSITSNQIGFTIFGEEVAIIRHLNRLMAAFLPGHFYKREAHSTQYVTFNGKKLQLQKGPSRFQYVELMFPSINAPYPKTGSKGLIGLKELSDEQRKQYDALVKDDSRNQKKNSNPQKLLPLDTSLSGHPALIVETEIKNFQTGSKRCSICGRKSEDLVKPSGNIYPLFYGQGNFTFDSNWRAKDKICSLCRYFGIFALYSLLSNWSRENKKIVINCFIPSGQDFKSLVTFTRAFREAREFWEWGNFRTDVSYTNRTYESFLALMKELTEKIKSITESQVKEIDFGLSLDEFEHSEPEVFYFRMDKTAQMPAVRNVVFFKSISYLIELFLRGKKEGVDFVSLFRSLLIRWNDGEVQTYIRNRICQSICYGQLILLDLEKIIKGVDDSYNIVKFLKFYLKEVSPVSFNVDRAESIGKSIGEGAFKDGERMKVIHEIRGANSYDQLLTAVMKVYSRLAGKGIEFYYINDFLKEIEPGNWREARAYLVINAINWFQYLKKQNTKKQGGD